MVKKVVEFQRVQLFDELWAQPLGDLAQHYGVVVADIRRAAQAMELPMPPSGHWTKAAHGKVGAKPARPDSDAPTIHQHSWYVSEEDEEIKRRSGPRMQSLQRIEAPMPPLATSLDECLPLVRLMSIRLKKAYQDHVPERIREAAVRLQLRDEIWAEQRRHREQLQATLDEQKALKEAELQKLAQFEDMARCLERATQLRALGAGA